MLCKRVQKILFLGVCFSPAGCSPGLEGLASLFDPDKWRNERQVRCSGENDVRVFSLFVDNH